MGETDPPGKLTDHPKCQPNHAEAWKAKGPDEGCIYKGLSYLAGFLPFTSLVTLPEVTSLQPFEGSQKMAPPPGKVFRTFVKRILKTWLRAFTGGLRAHVSPAASSSAPARPPAAQGTARRARVGPGTPWKSWPLWPLCSWEPSGPEAKPIGSQLVQRNQPNQTTQKGHIHLSRFCLTSCRCSWLFSWTLGPTSIVQVYIGLTLRLMKPRSTTHRLTSKFLAAK